MLKYPVARGKQGILFWLAAFKGKPSPKKTGTTRAQGGLHCRGHLSHLTAVAVLGETCEAGMVSADQLLDVLQKDSFGGHVSFGGHGSRLGPMFGASIFSGGFHACFLSRAGAGPEPWSLGTK